MRMSSPYPSPSRTASRRAETPAEPPGLSRTGSLSGREAPAFSFLCPLSPGLSARRRPPVGQPRPDLPDQAAEVAPVADGMVDLSRQRQQHPIPLPIKPPYGEYREQV